jgi:hypothetical protein
VLTVEIGLSRTDQAANYCGSLIAAFRISEQFQGYCSLYVKSCEYNPETSLRCSQDSINSNELHFKAPASGMLQSLATEQGSLRKSCKSSDVQLQYRLQHQQHLASLEGTNEDWIAGRTKVGLID